MGRWIYFWGHFHSQPYPKSATGDYNFEKIATTLLSTNIREKHFSNFLQFFTKLAITHFQFRDQVEFFAMERHIMEEFLPSCVCILAPKPLTQFLLNSWPEICYRIVMLFYSHYRTKFFVN